MFVKTERLIAKTVSVADAADLRAYYLKNREHLEPWEPARAPDFYELSAWRRKAAAQQANTRGRRSVHIIARSRERARVVAICNFNNIVYGAFCACHLGYSIDADEQGKGLMYEALSATLPVVFDEFKLHRIMANYLPENARSGRLLKRLGFEEEGFARAYLEIAGVWRDHILTSLINDALDAGDAPVER